LFSNLKFNLGTWYNNQGQGHGWGLNLGLGHPLS